jgi:MFS family permease
VLLNSAGMMGETVVLGWLTLELTNSPFLVGVAMGARMLPLFFVGMPAGVLADQFPRHRLLMLTAGGQALTAATLGLLTLSGLVSLPAILLLTVAAGTIRGIGDGGLRPARARLLSFTVHDPGGRRVDRAVGIRRARPSAVHSLMGALPPGGDGLRRIVLISATVESGRIVRLRRLHSR